MDYLFVNLFTESISFVLYELVALQQRENPAQKKGPSGSNMFNNFQITVYPAFLTLVMIMK